jgi:hypothetical protein
LYLGANISGAVGLAALATSAFFYVRSSSSRTKESTTVASSREHGSTPSLRMVDVQAGASGALATIGGTF